MLDKVLEVIDKPWGKEELLEKNDCYMVKRLTMNSGQCCSIQFHEKKVETVYVLSGILKLHIGPALEYLSVIKMKAGEFITIHPQRVHRMEAEETAVYLEASTPEMTDVVRLEDKYDRA